jgi:hypothetical protein
MIWKKMRLCLELEREIVYTPAMEEEWSLYL